MNAKPPPSRGVRCGGGVRIRPYPFSWVITCYGEGGRLYAVACHDSRIEAVRGAARLARSFHVENTLVIEAG